MQAVAELKDMEAGDTAAEPEEPEIAAASVDPDNMETAAVAEPDGIDALDASAEAGEVVKASAE